MNKLIFGLMLAGPLGASAAYAQEAAPVEGGTVIVAVGAEPATLLPSTSSGAAEASTGCMIHDGLVEIDGDGNYVPNLAKSWTISEDETSYAFELQEANWHDGEPFTSADVEYFFSDVVQYAPLISGQLEGKIESVVTDGDHKVTVNLTEPFGPFLRMMACFNGGALIPKHIYEGLNPSTDQAGLSPIGTGPFKFVEWNTGESIRLEANDDYWRGDIPLDAAVVRIMPNAGSRVQALLAGEVDYIYSYFVPLNDFTSIENDPGLKLTLTGMPPNNLLGFFNIRKEPFSNKDVRQALFSVIDRDFIWEAVFQSRGLPATAPIPKQLKWAADPELDYSDFYPMDVDAANAKLDAAGYERGADGTRFTTSIIYEANNPERLQTATIIQAAWDQLGVKAELMPLENAIALPRVYEEHDFDVFIVSYNTYADPALGVARIWITNNLDRAWGNASGYSNPEIDAAFEEAGRLSDVASRAAIYRELQKTLIDDLPTMTFHENVRVDASTQKLKGLWGYEGYGQWYKAYLEQ